MFVSELMAKLDKIKADLSTLPLDAQVKFEAVGRGDTYVSGTFSDAIVGKATDEDPEDAPTYWLQVSFVNDPLIFESLYNDQDEMAA